MTKIDFLRASLKFELKSLFEILALSLVATSTMGLADQPYQVIIERGVPSKMRDGILLRSDVYRPKAEGKFPVLLRRTPYNKLWGAEWGPDVGYRAAERGYVVIIQDTRGRFTSEGDWYPFKNEAQDGYDTVEWAAALPYSNGRVGMFGASYVGATQWLAASAAPPHLAGIFPEVTASNFHANWTYQGGAFEQWFNESWVTGLAQDSLDRKVQAHARAIQNIWKLPLSEYPLFKTGLSQEEGPWGLAPYFMDWLAHPDYDEYWKRWSIEEQYEKIKIPVYNIGAWYDIFLGGTLRNYLGMKARGGSDAARRNQRLLIFLGGHAGGGPKLGDVDFGPNAAYDGFSTMLRWYDYLLKGVPNGLDREKPVKILVLGKNVWREEDEWPLSRAQTTRYFLHSAGSANSLAGDGYLSPAAPKSEPPDHYTYDPSDPVPTRGGSLCCNPDQLAAGAIDQRPVEARSDVLVFSTPVLKRDLEVTGPITVEVYASSSAVDTDFTGKLVDVWPNGFAQNLTDGILRARFLSSQEKPEFLNPSQIYKLEIDLWATSNVFLAGHRLRLEISSSNFPRFDRNLNTGNNSGRSDRWVKAVNTVYHDSEHTSAALLPIVPQ